MLRRLIVTAALAASTLAVPAVASAPAGAATIHAASATSASSANCYRRDGNVWRCITPGAFCPKAARGKYGYAKITKRRYKCTFKSSDPFWRWRR